MKLLSKVVLGLALGASLASSAFASASGGHYGLPMPKALSHTPSGAATERDEPVFFNKTPYAYTLNSRFEPSEKLLDVQLNPQYSGSDVYTFTIDTAYDNQVCLNIIRTSDQRTVYSNCLGYGWWDIGPSYNPDGTPIISVHQG
ncbi:MAG: hypothetical protein SFW66_00055 [Gammaproteobacteria bacterium]|nr:hypothetical protein [Gammaproteobacteria bacterium]